MDSDDLVREKIITLSQHTSKTVREIAVLTGVHYSTVSRIVSKFNDTGSTKPSRKGRSGRKSVTTAREKRMIISQSKIDPRLTANDLRIRTNVNASNRTVRRILTKVGRFARRPLKKQLLTAAMKKKRLQWAKEYRHWGVEQWRKVLFSDETHFFVQGHQARYVRRSSDEPISPLHVNQAVKHPQKVMFWGCFSNNEPGRLHLCEGMVNQHQYTHIIETRVIPQMRSDFPFDEGIFQHDLAPCHTAKKVKAKLDEANISVLKWPGNSPDVNPIENMWSIVKQKLQTKDTTTKNRLIRAVLDIWNHDDSIKNICQTLIESMPTRVSALLKAKGGHINY